MHPLLRNLPARVLCPRSGAAFAGAVWQEDATAPEPSPVNVDNLDGDLLSEVIDTHLDGAEELNTHQSFEAADAWGVGAIAFLLLCGYPPFFAPCRYAILSRIDKTDYAFDPPFWSKISEEAKDFVQQCLRGPAEERLPVEEALNHPWIHSLADTSPSGSMLSSFALNLRRFYRTSIIESFAANNLAAKLDHVAMTEMFARCSEVDLTRSGFFTATDLRQVLTALGYNETAEAIAMCFSRTLRHPGESYIDYGALMDAIRARRERLLEDTLWECFQGFTEDECQGSRDGQMPISKLADFLQDSEVQQALLHDGIQDCSAFAEEAQRHAAECAGSGGPSPEVDFIEIASEVIQHLPPVPTTPGSH